MGLSDKKFQRLKVDNNTRLSAGLSDHVRPAWSPDGNWLAYAAEGGGDVQIYVCDTSGRLARQISAGQGVHTSPVWAPDGRTIAYAWRKTSQGRWQIWRGDLHDPSLTKVILNSTRFNYEDAAFSPDGRSLVYASSQGSSNTAYNLWTLDLESGEKQQLTADTARHDTKPAFDPSGNRLIFSGAASDKVDAPQLYTLNLETMTESKLTNSKINTDACFVDSSLVLYTRLGGKRGSAIRAMNMETLANLRLADGCRDATASVSEKGGISLAWSSNADSDHNEVYSAALEGYKADKASRGWTPTATPFTPQD